MGHLGLTPQSIYKFGTYSVRAKEDEEAKKLITLFTEALKIDEEISELLVVNGFSSLEEVAYVPKDELLAIEAFDEEIVDELRNRANDTLLTQALTGGAADGSVESLATLEGMTDDILDGLMAVGITTRDLLAEHAVDEILDIQGMTEEKAAALIMKAREGWFESDET